MSNAYKKPSHTPESYSPKTKPELLSMMAETSDSRAEYPSQYRIKPKGKTADYSGASWPHSNAYPAMFAAVALFYGKESRLNTKGEQINDDAGYHIQAALSTEAYGVQYSQLFKGGNLKNCFGIYGIAPQVVECSHWEEARVRDFVCKTLSQDKTVIIEPKEYKDMHFVFGYSEEGKTLLCCPFLDGDDRKNSSFNFRKYYRRKNRTAHVKRLIVLEETDVKLSLKDAYRQSLKSAVDIMTATSPDMNLIELRGAGTGLYDAWAALLRKANEENSEKYYMEFPVFPQFIILYESRLHLCEFLKTCAESYDENPKWVRLVKKSEEIRDLIFEDAENGFHRSDGDPKYHAMTNNERRSLLIEVLMKCKKIEEEMYPLLKDAYEELT